MINDTRLHRRFESLKTSLYSINYHKLTINYQQTTIPDRFPSRNFIISIWIVLLTYFPGEEIVVKIMSNTNRFRIVATHVLIIRGYDKTSLIDSFLSFFFFFFFFFFLIISSSRSLTRYSLLNRWTRMYPARSATPRRVSPVHPSPFPYGITDKLCYVFRKFCKKI